MNEILRLYTNLRNSKLVDYLIKDTHSKRYFIQAINCLKGEKKIVQLNKMLCTDYDFKSAISTIELHYYMYKDETI